MSFQTENMRLESMGDRLTSHKISKYIDYPNMKELFLSLQRIIMRGGSHSPVGATVL